MDRHALDPFVGKVTKEPTQLPGVPDRVHAPYGMPREHVEHAPAARTDREPTATEVRLDRSDHLRRETLVSSLEVEHKLGVVTRCGKQLVELQSRTPWRDDLPPVPEYGQWPHSLQVTDLELRAEAPNVSFDERGREVLGCPQVVEAVPRAMRDEKRGLPAGEEPRRELPTHWNGV